MDQEQGRTSDEKSETLKIVLGLSAITLFALLIRFYKLGEWSFWIDEIYTINRAIAEYSPSTPLTERLIGLTFTSLPINEWSARLVPALIGIITIPVLFFPIKQIFNVRVAFISVTLLAFSTVHLFWSQNARYYVALLLFYNLALFAFYFWLERERFLYLGITFLFLGLALIERKTALYLLPVILVYMLILVVLKVERPKGYSWRNLLIFGIPIAVGGVIIAVLEAQGFETQFLVHSTNPIRFMMAVTYDLGVPLLMIAAGGAIYLLKEQNRAGILMVSAAFIPLILLLVTTPFSLVVSRYLFATLPGWLILAAIVIDKISKMGFAYAKPLALLLLGILIIDSAAQDVLYFGYQNGNRADWKSAFNLVEQNVVGTDLVISSRQEIGEYYLDQDVAPSYAASPERIKEEGNRAWFVLDNQTGNVTPALRAWLNDYADLVGVNDVYLPGKLFEMRVFLFQP